MLCPERVFDSIFWAMPKGSQGASNIAGWQHVDLLVWRAEEQQQQEGTYRYGPKAV